MVRVLEVICEYVDNQGDDPAFLDFVRRKVDDATDVGVGADDSG